MTFQFAPKEDCRLPLAVTPVTTSCHSLLSTCLFLRRHSFLQIQNRTQQPIYASMNVCYTCIPLDTLHVNCRGRWHMDFIWSMHNDIYNTDTNVWSPFLSAVFSTQYVHFLERLNCCLGSICPSGLDMIYIYNYIYIIYIYRQNGWQYPYYFQIKNCINL